MHLADETRQWLDESVAVIRESHPDHIDPYDPELSEDAIDQQMNRYADWKADGQANHGLGDEYGTSVSAELEGASRVAYQFHIEGELYVLKFSKTDWHDQNSIAIEQFTALSKAARSDVARLVAWADDGGWLIQELVNSGAILSNDELDGLYERLSTACGGTLDRTEFRNANCGYRLTDGAPVLCDLGALR